MHQVLNQTKPKNRALKALACTLFLVSAAFNPEIVIGGTFSALAIVVGVPLWIYKLVTSPKLSIVLSTHMATKGQYTEAVANLLGFPLDSYSLSTPGFAGPTEDLMERQGKLSSEALQAAQTYFRHVVPEVLRAPDKRSIMKSSQLAAIHPELADFVAAEGGSPCCLVFASIKAYDYAWHSDSHVVGLNPKLLVVYGKKHMRMMPFENALGWHRAENRDWAEYKGEPTRGIVDENSWLALSFEEGEIFSMKTQNLHHVGTEVNDEGLSLMINCISYTVHPHPFGWITTMQVWKYAAMEAMKLISLYLPNNPDAFASGGNGDALKTRTYKESSNEGNSSCVANAVDIQGVESTISRTIANLKSDLVNSGLQTWNYPPQMGVGFDAMYYFVLRALGNIKESQFDTQAFTNLILQSQQSDGSWEQVPDSLSTRGDLDTTVFVFWYLKTVCGDCTESLTRARDFVLQHGGLQSTQTMTKFKLATFGKYAWEETRYIPLAVLQGNRTGLHGLVHKHGLAGTAQWVPQHLLPMAYLRARQVLHPVGADISELYYHDSSSSPFSSVHKRATLVAEKRADNDLIGLIQHMLSLQQPLGSFGAYTVATELTLLCLQDFKQAFPKQAVDFPQLETDIQRAFRFLERVHFSEAGGSRYQGPVMSGVWWDSLVVSRALINAGVESSELNETAALLISDALQETGGVCYGRDFEYAPDTDDTSVFVLLMDSMGGNEEYAEKSRQWLASMQNEDGGFPAFHTGKNPSWLLQKAFELSLVADSAEIFDVSSADLTGHVLEALGTSANYTKDHPVVAKAITYLKKTQQPFGAWEGRWGVNYIYAVGAVLPGLARVGADVREPWVINALTWLLSHQNGDGGFGESLKSYDNEIWAGIGKSTVSQTAWALLALLEAPRELEGLEEAIQKAVQFLVNSFESNGGDFKDTSVVGTGHRNIVNLQYPVYAKAFPLLALAKYKERLF